MLSSQSGRTVALGDIILPDSDYSDGMDEATFSAAIKHVVTSRLGWDVIVAYVIQQEYTNWDRVDDPVERRSGYVNVGANRLLYEGFRCKTRYQPKSKNRVSAGIVLPRGG